MTLISSKIRMVAVAAVALLTTPLWGRALLQNGFESNTSAKDDSRVGYAAGTSINDDTRDGSYDYSALTDNPFASQTATQLLQSCALRQLNCDLIRRAASGEVLQLRQAVVNLASIEVEGIDSTMRYVVDSAVGRFDAMIDLSYLGRFRTSIVQPDDSLTIDDRAGKSDQPRSTFPRVKAQAGLRYSRNGLEAGYKARYIGSSKDVPG